MSSRKLLDYHRPQSLQIGSKVIDRETRRCIRNLAAYKVPKALRRKGPRCRTAAVLVALFIGRMGDVYVLLSQRAKSLRTYAGDTSLPGGKMESMDRHTEDTAVNEPLQYPESMADMYTKRREAFEEIGLSMDREKVPLLCTLEPFLAGDQLLVTPVVVLVLDKTLRQPVLNQEEVTTLFSHPLRAFLSSESPFPNESHTEEVPYYTYNDISWYRGDRNRSIRMHRFLTGREAGGIKPIYGFTAAILIRVAEIGFGHPPDFEVLAHGQPSMTERIDFVLQHDPRFIRTREEDELKAKSQSSGIVKEFLKRAPQLQVRKRRIGSRL